MKKFSWILALLAALAMIFVGVGCGGGGGNDDPPPPAEDLLITDAAEIGALLEAVGYYGDNIAGGDKPVVKADGSKMTFDYPQAPASGAGPDNFGFRFDFPEGVEAGHLSLELTFKLVEVKKLTGGFAKIGFKSAKGSGDVTPYAQHEVIFGDAENEGEEFIQVFSLNNPNKLPNKAVWIAHNQYGEAGKPETKGSEGETNYTIQITKVLFKGGAPVAKDLTKDEFTVGKIEQFLDQAGGIVAVTVTAKDGMDVGTISVAYEGTDGTTYAKSATVPGIAGKFKILVSTTGSAAWKAATDLEVGILTIGANAPAEFFKLSTNAAFQAADIDSTDIGAGGFLQGAGGTLTVVQAGATKGIKLVSGANWNGLDLQANKFEFAAGDKITVILDIVELDGASAQLMFDVSHNGWKPIGATITEGITAGATNIEITRTLEEGDLLTQSDHSGCTANPACPYPIGAVRLKFGDVTSFTIIVKEIIVIKAGS